MSNVLVFSHKDRHEKQCLLVISVFLADIELRLSTLQLMSEPLCELTSL